MKKILFIAALQLSIIFIACNHAQQKNKSGEAITIARIETPPGNKDEKEEANSQDKIPIGTLQNSQASDTESTPVAALPKQVANQDWDSKIIKTATLKLEVKDFKKYNETLIKTVKQFGGYIASEEQNITAEKYETVMSIKVPVYQFEGMINQLPDTGSKVLARTITSDDVTGKIVDTKSRLEAKKEMRIKYMEFLKQSKNMKEVLEVQGEINGIQEEIEAAAAQVSLLSHQSAFSTIDLTFYQPLPGYIAPTTETPSFLTRLAKAFKSGTAWVVDIFVALMSVWPLILLVGAGIFLLRKSRALKLFPVTNQSPDKK